MSLAGELASVAQVVLVDLTLAGDNAIVLGTIAGTLAGEDRRRAMTLGILIAAVLRILLAVMATRLLAVVGLSIAGGIVLLWVAWKMVREVTGADAARARDGQGHRTGGLRRALVRIVVADLSMSLDNVLAVAGTARGDMAVLVLGLVLSVALMGTAAVGVARVMERLPWIAWAGIATVAYAAIVMIVQGWGEVGRYIA